MHSRGTIPGWRLVALPAFAVALLLTTSTRAGANDGLACGATITVDTTLTGDLRHCPGDGLIVATNGVTLDLAGHTLTGSGAGSGITITGTGVTVTNGVVKGFAQGIDVEVFGDQSTLSGLAVNRNGTGLTVGVNSSTGPSHGTVSDSSFKNNDVDGVFLHGSFWTIEGSTIARNGRDGVHAAVDVDVVTLVGDKINDNVGTGVSLVNQNDGSTIAGSVVSRNGGDGIRVETSTTHITGNTTRDNGGTGIWVLEEAGLSFGPFYLVADNTSIANAGYGIRACITVDSLHTCEPGITDGGGNVARRNQLMPECVNVVCTRH
jgi:hypothetical protein